MKISAIVMASGLSRRMGENKLLLDFKGKKIYEHTLDMLEKSKIDEVILVSSYKEILEDGEKRGFKTVYNDNNEVGKSASIKLGVKNCDKDSAMMFFVADQPLLTVETVDKLIDSFNGEKIAYPRTEKRRGAPVIFSNDYREGLLALDFDQGGMVLVNDENKNEVFIDNIKELWDIDTYKNLEELKDA